MAEICREQYVTTIPAELSESGAEAEVWAILYSDGTVRYEERPTGSVAVNYVESSAADPVATATPPSGGSTAVQTGNVHDVTLEDSITVQDLDKRVSPWKAAGTVAQASTGTQWSDLRLAHGDGDGRGAAVTIPAAGEASTLTAKSFGFSIPQGATANNAELRVVEPADSTPAPTIAAAIKSCEFLSKWDRVFLHAGNSADYGLNVAISGDGGTIVAIADTHVKTFTKQPDGSWAAEASETQVDTYWQRPARLALSYDGSRLAVGDMRKDMTDPSTFTLYSEVGRVRVLDHTGGGVWSPLSIQGSIYLDFVEEYADDRNFGSTLALIHGGSVLVCASQEYISTYTISGGEVAQPYADRIPYLPPTPSDPNYPGAIGVGAFSAADDGSWVTLQTALDSNVWEVSAAGAIAPSMATKALDPSEVMTSDTQKYGTVYAHSGLAALFYKTVGEAYYNPVNAYAYRYERSTLAEEFTLASNTPVFSFSYPDVSPEDPEYYADDTQFIPDYLYYGLRASDLLVDNTAQRLLYGRMISSNVYSYESSDWFTATYALPLRPVTLEQPDPLQNYTEGYTLPSGMYWVCSSTALTLDRTEVVDGRRHTYFRLTDAQELGASAGQVNNLNFAVDVSVAADPTLETPAEIDAVELRIEYEMPPPGQLSTDSPSVPQPWSAVTFTDDPRGPTGYTGGAIGQGVIIIVGVAGKLLRSVDGGETWTAVDFAASAGLVGRPTLRCAAYADGQFFAAGANGVAVVSQDLGVSWSAVDLGVSRLITGVTVTARGVLLSGRGVSLFSERPTTFSSWRDITTAWGGLTDE